MLDSLLHSFLYAPARLVRAGLWTFFGGTGALLSSVLAQWIAPGEGLALAQRLPGWSTWFVPESPAGYTAAVMAVAWGVWAMGAGVQRARERRR